MVDAMRLAPRRIAPKCSKCPVARRADQNEAAESPNPWLPTCAEQQVQLQALGHTAEASIDDTVRGYSAAEEGGLLCGMCALEDLHARVWQAPSDTCANDPGELMCISSTVC